MTAPRPELLTLRYDHAVQWCEKTVGALVVLREWKQPQQVEGVTLQHRRTLRLVDNSTEGIT
jgi:hypothetical protein